MDLNIFISILFTLFAGGHSLECYQCIGVDGTCKHIQQTCPTEAQTCASGTVMASAAGTNSNIEFKNCEMTHNCVNGSMNTGISRATISMQCCNRDLCNSRDVPDYSFNRLTGKQCYYCDGKSCLNKLNCVGTEDSCITATAHSGTKSMIVKGCASKPLCDAASQTTTGLKGISCCQGNLCNSAKNITLNLLFFSWPFFFYIMFQ